MVACLLCLPVAVRTILMCRDTAVDEGRSSCDSVSAVLRPCPTPCHQLIVPCLDSYQFPLIHVNLQDERNIPTHPSGRHKVRYLIVVSQLSAAQLCSKYMYSRLSQAATSTSAKAHLHPIFTSGSAKYPVLTHVCPSFPNISTLNQRQTETLAPLISRYIRPSNCHVNRLAPVLPLVTRTVPALQVIQGQH